MGIKTEIVMTSRYYQNGHLTGQNRILDICKREGATVYINLKGGQTLYDRAVFHNSKIDLQFLVMRPRQYKQRGKGFVSHLSIIDALMEIGPEEIMAYMAEFELYANSGHAVSDKGTGHMQQ